VLYADLMDCTPPKAWVGALTLQMQMAPSRTWAMEGVSRRAGL